MASSPFAFDTTLKGFTSSFNFTTDPRALTSGSLPVVDFSALTAGDPHQRSKSIHELARACQEWGFFILVNHGIPEGLMNAAFNSIKEFFGLPENEKKQYEAKSASDPIKCGNFIVTNTSSQSFTLWRDYLKLNMHPHFHCPQKPQTLREAIYEYGERSRNLARALIEAVVDAFELDGEYANEVLKMDSSFQLFAANYYPPCPHPDQAIGIPPHTDHGLFTLLIHNGVAGLQIEHDGQWFDADSPQNSILVNAADQLEIFTNGRCKSVKHRAVVNKDKERISLVVANGPSKDAIVGAAAPLVEKDGRCMYKAMQYEEYVEAQLTKTFVNGKSMLEQQMIVTQDT